MGSNGAIQEISYNQPESQQFVLKSYIHYNIETKTNKEIFSRIEPSVRARGGAEFTRLNLRVDNLIFQWDNFVV
jgi:hypothetical protein